MVLVPLKWERQTVGETASSQIGDIEPVSVVCHQNIEVSHILDEIHEHSFIHFVVRLERPILEFLSYVVQVAFVHIRTVELVFALDFDEIAIGIAKSG